jgi:uncharacterized membrane protein YidH (DUF202 family)
MLPPRYQDFSRFGRTLSLPGQKFGNIAGLALIVLGTAMVGIAAARFVMTAKNIDREDLRPGTGSRIDIAFAGLLVLLGCALFLLMYLSHDRAMRPGRSGCGLSR